MVSLVSAARDIGRLREVSTVLVRHGFGQIAGRLGIRAKGSEPPPDDSSAPRSTGRPGAADRPSLSERIRLVLEDLGPTFVKLGQVASTRPDLLPPELIAELKKLQDAVPPLPFEEIEEQLELSLGAPISELYESFERAHIAAASIAQVHRASICIDDEHHDVAVKVQRPGIAKTIASDLEILHTLAALLERAVPETRIYSPIGLVRQFDHAITAELDFTTEADHARRFAQDFSDNPHVVFPAIHRHLSSRQVLTMEFIEGNKIYDAIEKGHSGKLIARLALRTMVTQIYENGFFHADPHPGNVLISGDTVDPTLTMLDLGMVGHLSPRMRDLSVDVITAALRRDYEGIAEALYEIGSPTKKVNMEAYKADVALLSEKYLGRQLSEIELSALIRDLVVTATKYGIEIPTDFVMMGKSLMTIEGIGKEIDPDFEVYEEAKPLFSDVLRRRYSPERVGNELLRRIERLGGASYKVPAQIEEVLDDLRFGRLTIRTTNDTATRSTERLGRRVFTAILTASLLLSGAIVHAGGAERLGLAMIGLSVLPMSTFLIGDVWRSFRRR